MSLFNDSAWVPKTACTLLPTSTTPAAPRFFSRALSTLLVVRDLHAQPSDAGVDVDEILPAAERRDQLLGHAVGHHRLAPLVEAGRLTSASNSASGSRPGVLMFHFVIANRNMA